MKTLSKILHSRFDRDAKSEEGAEITDEGVEEAFEVAVVSER